MAVIVDMRSPGAPKWKRMPIAVLEGASSSLSSQSPTVREIYHFGYWDEVPGVWVSQLGADVEVGLLRFDDSKVDLLADLRQGPCELTIYRGSTQIRTRFRLAEESESEVLRQSIEELVRLKHHESVTLFLVMAATVGRGEEAERVFRETVENLADHDHDLRHFWLDEACPCQAPKWN